MATKAQKAKVIAEQSVEIDIDSVKTYRKNPRVGNLDAIRESIRENGFFAPIVVQKSTGEILAGNHRWMAAKAEGLKKVPAVYVDVDDERAAKIVLADNRTNDLASYNTEILSDILSGLPQADVGTGYDDTAVKALLEGMNERNAEAVENIIRPPVSIPSFDDSSFQAPEQDNSVGGPPPMDGDSGEVWTGQTLDNNDDGGEDLDDQLGELQGILQLKEDMTFKSSNYYDIPDLVPAGLLDKLPTPLDTWGGQDATPDDGKTTWVWNYGVAAKKGLPMDRAILCFYTYDTYFESFWENPAFMTAKVLNAGIKTAVVPDFSYYSELSTAWWIYNTFRAQWLGRYFQEAGIKVIPRIQYAIDKKDSTSLDFCTLGIPKNAPIVAKSSHNANTKEEFDLEVYGLGKCLEKVEPNTLLIYGGNPAKRVVEALKPVERGLCNEVVHIYNYAHKRRGVVFDKKEGLAARKKDKKRLERDRTTEKDAPEDKKTEAASDDAGLD